MLTTALVLKAYVCLMENKEKPQPLLTANLALLRSSVFISSDLGMEGTRTNCCSTLTSMLPPEPDIIHYGGI